MGPHESKHAPNNFTRPIIIRLVVKAMNSMRMVGHNDRGVLGNCLQDEAVSYFLFLRTGKVKTRRPTSLNTRRELSQAIAERYHAADRQSKRTILVEFIEVTGFHRKHAIRVLTRTQMIQPQQSVGRRVYQETIDEALIILWEAADRICGKRLKALVSTLVDAMERHGQLGLDDIVRELLLSMSAATIDRRLQKVRAQAFGSKRKKHSLNRVRKLVVVKTFADWEQARPGMMEVDLVAHCGTRAVGSFVHTLALTDVASGWTECIALPVREQALIVEAITAAEVRLPLLGVDTDNDSTFMNDTLCDYCQARGLEFTRCRAYHKREGVQAISLAGDTFSTTANAR